MPNTCYDAANFEIPSWNHDAQSADLTLKIHPRQLQLLDEIAGAGKFPFKSATDVARWCLAWGTRELLQRTLPHPMALMEAKTLLRDEPLESLLAEDFLL